MKIYVTLGLLVLILFESCDAACFRALTKISNGMCNYNDYVDIPDGNKLRVECDDCTCESAGLFGIVTCCSAYTHYTDYPSHCTVVKDGCKEELVDKNDPTLKCDAKSVTAVKGR